MSGGSFNYLFSKFLGEGEGFLDGLFREGQSMLDSARRALAEHESREIDERGVAEKGRSLTDEERALAEEALAEFEHLVAILQKIGAHVGDHDPLKPSPLREILHAVEWMESGDGGRDGVVGRLIEAGRTRRERATLRLVEESAEATRTVDRESSQSEESLKAKCVDPKGSRS